jgi:general secretion pathway protein G
MNTRSIPIKSWVVGRGSWVESRITAYGHSRLWARCNHESRGFTLLELLITVAIISLVATVALPFAELTVQRGKEVELKRSLRQIRDGIDAYKRAADEGRIERKTGASGYPPNLQALVDGVADARSPESAKLYFLRRIPRDPFHRDARARAEETWGLRSHSSPVDYPQAGDDVFDVYSLSRSVGLNGVPLKEW